MGQTDLSTNVSLAKSKGQILSAMPEPEVGSSFAGQSTMVDQMMLKMVDLQQDDLERALEKEMDNIQSTEAAEMHDLLSNFSGFLSIRRVFFATSIGLLSGVEQRDKLRRTLKRP